MSVNRHLLLGLFFTTIVATLGYFTLFKTDFPLLGEKKSMTVFFNNTSGLRQGDSVLVAGMRWGQIDELSYHPERPLERRISVRLTFNNAVTLYKDHKISIEDATVLGGKHLAIEPGLRESGPVPEDFIFYGDVGQSALDALGELVDENRESLRNILSGLDRLVGDLQGGEGVLGMLLYDRQLADNLTKAVTSITATFENADYLTGELASGKGTLGKLMSSDDLYPKIQDAVSNLDALLIDSRDLVATARTGDGTVGLLMSDRDFRASVEDTMAKLTTMIGSIDRGEGTIGRFYRDDTFAKNLEQFSASLVTSEGTLGRMITDPVLYDNALTVSEQMKQFTTALTGTDGSLGKLVNDDALYIELERALATLTGSLEEAREAAPISTFLSTLFLGF